MYKRKSVLYLPRHDEGIFKGLVEELKLLWVSRFVALNLFQVKLYERYQGSVLGVLWSVITPTLMMVIMSLIFPLLMRMKVENYVVYLFSGLIVWRLISSAISLGGNAIVGYKPLITKVALPSMLYPIVVVMVEFANFIVVMAALHVIAWLFGFAVNTHLLYLLAAVLITALFCVGVSALLSLLVVYFRDVKQILEMIVQGFFYLTPIIYPIAMIPEKYHILMEFNIFYHFVNLFHQAIYEPGKPDWSDMLIPLIVTFVLLFISLLLHRRLGRQLVFRV